LDPPQYVNDGSIVLTTGDLLVFSGVGLLLLLVGIILGRKGRK
jgi:hypothetical protein